ncbi:MAG: succinate dehydrogenase [Alphaproteobacteria bacterium]|jgi:fumarate reductase subunit D|nr:succinate dehydrogenase [Rhodospirillaceae bacterium]MDP6404465.1 succinate dehydrogenase [Alphaproteobacteria bacterium]MDP6621750.1 succinate dehydrogenase [Alphaproteobacteria bacterium]
MSGRSHPAYWAFVVHRASGLALAAFVPLHLYVLSLALEQTATLDRFLAWSTAPWVKLAETVLVVALAAHLAGGLRLLAVEFLPWREGQTALIALAGAVAVAAGLFFLLNAL